MTGFFFIITLVCALYLAVTLRKSEAEARKYKVKWHECLSDRGAEDSLIFEWSCRDLMPEWEQLYPHVKDMPNQRKYSEWATFCANYPTRESIIAHLDLEL